MNHSIRNQKNIARIFTGIRQEFRPNRLVTSLTAGVIGSMVQIVMDISLAALIFSGELSGFIANGIGLVLFTTIIIGTILTLFTSLPGTMGGSQDIPAAILAGVAATIAATLSSTTTPHSIFLTIVIVMGVTSLCTGIFLWALGQFKLGGLVRFLPYPVVGGFLAGTGWLITSGALSTMTDQSLNLALLQPEMLLRWLPGLVFAITLLFVLNRFNHSLVIPGMVIGGTLLFYLVAFLTNSSTDVAAQGWVLGPFPKGGLWQPISLTDLGQVQWSAIGHQAVHIPAILIMSAVALLLNGTGLELAVRRDMDFNRELKVAGIANIISGLTGNMTGYHELSASLMNHKLGADSRLTGLIRAGIGLLVLLFGASVLSLIPKMILGGLLLYLGISFLIEWVYDAWYKLPKMDYFVVILILLVTAFVGFLEAVGVGLITAVILFVINYSRIDIVRNELSCTTQQSRVTRPSQQQLLLDEHGDEVYILSLQGFIFFGTADNLLNTIRERIKNPDLPLLKFIILDFRRVTAIDSTASLSFTKLKQLAEAKEITLALAEITPSIQAQLKIDNSNQYSHIHIFPDLDHSLEWCEQQLLAIYSANSVTMGQLPQQLQSLLPHTNKIERLVAYLERQEVAAGQYLIRQATSPDDLFFIEAGQVTAQLQRPGQEPIRLQTMSSGHIVGEIGFYLGQQRTADVITDEPSIVYRLSHDMLKRMEIQDPDIASTLHQLIVHRLAERVNHLVTAVHALQQ